MTPPLLVFDLDGTLADTAPDLLATLDVVLPRYGFGRGSGETIREGVGHGARYLLEYALAEQGAAVDAATLDAMYRDYLIYYEANICVRSRLFPGAVALLDRFAASGWRFAICTNKPEELSRRLLQKLGVAERFAAICGGDSFPHKKPDPAHLLDTVAAAAGAREATVMVGDSRTDRDTARAADIPFIGVTFGYTPVPMASLEPDVLVDSFDAIRPEDSAALLKRRQRDARQAQPPAAAVP